MVKYEYLVITTVTESNWASISKLPADSRPPVEHKSKYYIWKPGAAEPETPPDGSSAVQIYNELGQDGWKMIERTVSHTAVYDYSSGDIDFYGHRVDIGSPVQTWTTFMREVDSQ